MAATATIKEVRDALQINVDKLKSESAQMHSVIKALAALGYHKAPKIVSGKLDGSTVRVFHWAGTPAGDLLLVTGPAFLPRICGLEDIRETRPGVYILAEPDTTKVASRAEAYASRPARTPAPPKAPTQARAREAAKKAAGKVATGSPSVGAVEASERDELVQALSKLLG